LTNRYIAPIIKAGRKGAPRSNIVYWMENSLTNQKMDIIYEYKGGKLIYSMQNRPKNPLIRKIILYNEKMRKQQKYSYLERQ